MQLWALTFASVVIIVITLRDVVHELFHPQESGSISRGVMRGGWWAIRRVGRHRRGALLQAGPAILMLVALVWTVLLLAGWALFYLPRLPGEFSIGSGLAASAARGVGAAVYLSIASMTTLGAGNIAPRGDVTRMALTLESFVGPLLITAWITWVLSIYPVLASRRAFALEVDLLRRANPIPAATASDAPAEAVVAMLRSLTEQLLRVAAQLQQSRVTYYFQNDAPRGTLVVQLPWVLALARAACASGRAPAVEHHGTMLLGAVREILSDLGAYYLDMRDAEPEAVLRSLAVDHHLTRELAASIRELGGRAEARIVAGRAAQGGGSPPASS
jgi:hypothetical protein